LTIRAFACLLQPGLWERARELLVPGGDLNLSACTQVSKTDVECARPSAAIADVSFVTYPTLSALYLHYREIISGLTGKKPFAAVQNSGACDATAPRPCR
jgi:hypothetical protein